MRRRTTPFVFPLLAATLVGCASAGGMAVGTTVPPGGIAHADDPDEPRLTNLRRLTSGGQNAEAYFSPDGARLIFQATMPGVTACDQQFTMTVDGQDLRMVSTGEGRTTCGYFYEGGERIVYSSTHHVAEACPAEPDYSMGYVWALYDYDVYTAEDEGGDLRRIFSSPVYDAEATLSPDGETIVFTSARDGDLDIYTMRTDGSDVRKLTDALGYDGGPFFSPDGSKIVYRAHHPTEPAQVADYQRLLAQGLIRPSTLDVWVMDADGANKVRVTNNGAANFGPYFHPSGDRILFSSNMHDPRGRDFDLYLIGVDGTGLERVTAHPDFDGFPQFSPVDPGLLVFASNRGGSVEGETNVFLADWVETPGPVSLSASVRPATGPATTTACPAIDPAAAGRNRADYTGRYLADDALEGRDAGTPGAACAAEYIAWTFRRLGLAPGGEEGSYFQDVPLASATNPHAAGGTGRNVLAVLPGTDRRADEYIVVGAHFDHLGWGGQGSLEPGTPAIHNGADDNASGVAALVRVAEKLAVGPRPRRPVLFMAFTGEEDGLLGAAHWTKNPTVPLEEVSAMINMDMVGRLRDNGLVVYGVGTAEEWNDVVDPLVAAAGIERVSRIPDGYGASDQTAFYMEDIPVLHLFTNTHSDYHRPSDDWDRIDVEGIETVAEIVAGITRRVGTAARMAVIPDVGRAPGTASADGPGYGAYLGTIPDFSPVEYGVLLGGVREGGPADLAGLRKGDIIVRMGDVEVDDLYALTDALRKYRPGDEVEIEYARGGERRVTTAVLTRR